MPDGLAPGIQGGVVSSSVQQNLGQPIQGAHKLRVDCERLAKLGFRTGRVRQRRAESTACLQQPGIILQSQLELLDRGVGLLLTLPHQPEIKMRLGRVRLQPQGLFEGRDGTFEIVFLGEPDAYGVVNLGGWRARRRMGGRCRGFAGGRQLLRQASCSDQESRAESAEQTSDRHERTTLNRNQPRLATLLLIPTTLLGDYHHAIAGHVVQQLARARWPADLDFTNHARVTQTEVNARIAGCGIAGAGRYLIVESPAVVSRYANLRTDAHAVAFGSDQFEQDPVIVRLR